VELVAVAQLIRIGAAALRCPLAGFTMTLVPTLTRPLTAASWRALLVMG